MIKRLFLMFATLFAYLSLSADSYMRVFDSAGDVIFKINVDSVGYVDFDEDSSAEEDSSVVDTSMTVLKFKILTDSTAELIEDKNNQYSSLRDVEEIEIPAKVRIDGKVYTVVSIGNYAFHKSG